MKNLFFLLIFLPEILQAQIFKCTENGKTIYSDTACGTNAEIIDIEEKIKPTGVRFSTKNMESLGKEMYKDRRKTELERDITRQEDKVEEIIDDYTSKTDKLNQELIDHKSNIDTRKWSKHAYKREKYYAIRRQLTDEIKEVRRKYKAAKEKAYNKLYSLKQQHRELRFEK